MDLGSRRGTPASKPSALVERDDDPFPLSGADHEKPEGFPAAIPEPEPLAAVGGGFYSREGPWNR
jgi:hypothetical protein